VADGNVVASTFFDGERNADERGAQRIGRGGFGVEGDDVRLVEVGD